MNKQDGFFYLATPYTADNINIRISRYKEAMRIMVGLERTGYTIYSPIVACHPCAIEYGLPGDFSYWEHRDIIFIKASSGVIVAKMDGWESSYGVQSEINIATRECKTVIFIDPKEIK